MNNATFTEAHTLTVSTKQGLLSVQYIYLNVQFHNTERNPSVSFTMIFKSKTLTSLEREENQPTKNIYILKTEEVLQIFS